MKFSLTLKGWMVLSLTLPFSMLLAAPTSSSSQGYRGGGGEHGGGGRGFEGRNAYNAHPYGDHREGNPYERRAYLRGYEQGSYQSGGYDNGYTLPPSNYEDEDNIMDEEYWQESQRMRQGGS